MRTDMDCFISLPLTLDEPLQRADDQQHQYHQHDGERRGQADAALRERELVDLHAGDHGRVAGATLRGHEHHVEAGERGHDGHGQADAELAAQTGDGDGEQLPPPAGAVEAGRLVQRDVDRADAAQQQHDAEAELEPEADDADRGQGRGLIAEPGVGGAVETESAQDLVDGAVVGEHPGPGHAGRGTGDDAGQEQADLGEGAGGLVLDVLDQGRGDQAEDDRQDREEDDEEERVADAADELGIGEHLDVVVDADEGAGVDAVPVVERVPGGLDDRPQFEHRVEDQRGCEEEVSGDHRRGAAAIGLPARAFTRAGRGVGGLGLGHGGLLSEFLFVGGLHDAGEFRGVEGAVEQQLEVRDQRAGLDAGGCVVDEVGGGTVAHQVAVDGEHLGDQRVAAGGQFAVAGRGVAAVVDDDLAGLLGGQVVEEGRGGVLVLGVGRDAEGGAGVQGGGGGVGFGRARVGGEAGGVTHGLGDGGDVPVAAGEEQAFAGGEAAERSGGVDGVHVAGQVAGLGPRLQRFGRGLGRVGVEGRAIVLHNPALDGVGAAGVDHQRLVDEGGAAVLAGKHHRQDAGVLGLGHGVLKLLHGLRGLGQADLSTQVLVPEQAGHRQAARHGVQVAVGADLPLIVHAVDGGLRVRQLPAVGVGVCLKVGQMVAAHGGADIGDAGDVRGVGRGDDARAVLRSDVVRIIGGGDDDVRVLLLEAGDERVVQGLQAGAVPQRELVGLVAEVGADLLGGGFGLGVGRAGATGGHGGQAGHGQRARGESLDERSDLHGGSFPSAGAFPQRLLRHWALRFAKRLCMRIRHIEPVCQLSA